MFKAKHGLLAFSVGIVAVLQIQNEDVTITNNEIVNNLGAGIGADPGTTGTNFQITGNKIYNNGTNLYGLSGTGIQELVDCFTQ